MAKIKAFRAIRPTRDKVHLVASRSYISYNKRDLERKLNENPYTFLHVINPHIKNEKAKGLKGLALYEEVKNQYHNFLNEDVFLQDEQASFYVYMQTKNGSTRTGLIAAASIDDYLNNHIKKHEQTIHKREEMFKDYLNTCSFNAEPVLVTYPELPLVTELVNKTKQTRPEYDFTSTNKVRHTLWLIQDAESIATIEHEFEKIPDLYIADGHHRSASSALLGVEKREQGLLNHPSSYYMVMLMPEHEMVIYDFNRLVKDCNGLSCAAILNDLSSTFDVEQVQGRYMGPPEKKYIGMYMEGSWFHLVPKGGTYNSTHPVDSLDASILSNNILSPLFGIKDLKHDKRISFISGVEGYAAMENLVNKGKYKIAFALHPITVEDIKLVADNNMIMPPKTTYIEPKLRSGLTIYSLSEF